MLQGSRNAGALIRGVMPDLEPHVSEIDQRMVRGKLSDLTPGSFGIVLGKELAQMLGGWMSAITSPCSRRKSA